MSEIDQKFKLKGLAECSFSANLKLSVPNFIEHQNTTINVILVPITKEPSLEEMWIDSQIITFFI